MRWTGCSRASAPGKAGWTDSTRTCAGKESTMGDPTPAAGVDQQVLITRIFDAPRERVFAAWTDPDQVAAWYGPEHFDTPREKVRIEPRVGGRWELTMVQRDTGAEYSLRYEIVELAVPELIVLRG